MRNFGDIVELMDTIRHRYDLYLGANHAPHKYIIEGYFNTYDMFDSWAENEAELKYEVTRIRANDTIGEWIITNNLGQLLYSNSNGLETSMKYPKYFEKYLERGEER